MYTLRQLLLFSHYCNSLTFPSHLLYDSLYPHQLGTFLSFVLFCSLFSFLFISFATSKPTLAVQPLSHAAVTLTVYKYIHNRVALSLLPTWYIASSLKFVSKFKIEWLQSLHPLSNFTHATVAIHCIHLSIHVRMSVFLILFVYNCFVTLPMLINNAHLRLCPPQLGHFSTTPVRDCHREAI